MFVVYLTIYKGKKLPPFYIGSSSLKKVNDGYLGSVLSKKYKDTWAEEVKENRHLFKNKIISYHNTRKEALEKESKIHYQLNVTKNPLYVNMSNAHPSKAAFGAIYDRKNHPRYGKKLNQSSKNKISQSLKNNKSRKINKKLNKPGMVVCCDKDFKGLKVTKSEYDKWKNIKYFQKNGKYIFVYKTYEIYCKFKDIIDFSFIEIKVKAPKYNRPLSQTHKDKISESKKGKKRDDVSKNMKKLRKNTSPAKCSKTGAHLGCISKDDPRWASGDIVGINKKLD